SRRTAARSRKNDGERLAGAGDYRLRTLVWVDGSLHVRSSILIGLPHITRDGSARGLVLCGRFCLASAVSLAMLADDSFVPCVSPTPGDVPCISVADLARRAGLSLGNWNGSRIALYSALLRRSVLTSGTDLWP